jgi:hypothetical protein
MLFEGLRDGSLLMVKAAVEEAPPKPNRSCDNDGASHKDAHGSTPHSLSIRGYNYEGFFREDCDTSDTRGFNRGAPTD